ncbi:DUF3606 domain-containing protein [Vineibacter terrae]|uniref:DUF3606 domain-containing protein n=1 Tax=Vineibacter terrae TaxID=2586908 RepID=UPI002E32B53B|nr:DUF3606 domain-containing protein [Vineibacter terrae]HEX2885281.1 DUF3606 domain-containing protein [Vineibacter terrae]
MPDDKTKPAEADRDRIDIDRPYDVHDWARKLGVTPEELCAAVKAAGPMADAVRLYLGK